MLAKDSFRPPAVPLVTCDPYFSIWSMNDRLTDGPTRHWTEKPQQLTSLVRIDGKTFRIMGDEPKEIAAASFIGLTVTPTQTIYEYEESGVRFGIVFTTPLLPDDLMVCARPVTYVTWTAAATDGKPHDVAVYLDVNARIAVNNDDQEVVFQKGAAGNLTTLRVGTAEQAMLETSGDDVRIDWGYFYLAADTQSAAIATASSARSAFSKSNELGAEDSAQSPVAAKDAPVLAMVIPFGKVDASPKAVHALLAYDDVASIRYFNQDLKAYWRKDGADISSLLQTAEKEYALLLKRCDAFDQELISDLRRIGGEAYVQLGSLAWRHALAAQKLCADKNGQPLMFSKENFSNGCIGTVDVLYPAAPQMLVFAPTMLKASLVPLLDYSGSPRWKHDSAPHDIGTYPKATGQVYGGEENSPMPVEECGNLLVLAAGVAKAEGNAECLRPYFPTLTTWANYLKAKGLDPENQLCTDDFAGHIARNANLSVKAIMGIASYGLIADMLGEKDKAADYHKTAREYAQKWMKLAEDGDHYQLVFGDAGKGTWSQKYNLVWDKLLGLNVFPPEVARKELAFYRTKMTSFGLPLDSRKSYTKLDWQFWTATMAENDEDFDAIINACAKWANETPARVPMTDWYDTADGKKSGFQARSVVGGLFIPFLRDQSLWRKYASRDKTRLTGWAKVDFTKPRLQTVAGTADKSAETWHYTFETPTAADWMAERFDASKWKTGKSGFGTRGTPGAHVGTVWNGPEIYMRREFTIAEKDLSELKLFMHHDEEAEVYINGVLAARPRGYTSEYVTVRIMRQAIEALRPGKNTIAVHCHQTINGQYIDVGLVRPIVGDGR